MVGDGGIAEVITLASAQLAILTFESSREEGKKPRLDGEYLAKTEFGLVKNAGEQQNRTSSFSQVR